MKFKKLLGIISVVIIVVFSMMLTTSYAWYAFDNASTAFEGMTNNDDIIVSYQRGEYINVTNAIPITQEQVDMYSEKNNFNIKVKNNVKDNKMLVSVSLVEISIDRSLQNANFKVELYHQSEKVADIAGNGIGTNNATTKKLADVILDNNVTNNFEFRLYILDDGADQSSLENKTFQAKIQVDVVSRLKTSLNDYNNPDIYISSVTIDGETSNYIPTSGYYNMTATCSKGSNLTWEPLSKTITYNSDSYVNDNCSLAFTSSTDYPLLSGMPIGSYVKYTGTNGCEGIHCEGYNANYVSDTDMGYCSGNSYDFTVNGWRLAYVEDGSPHLISAGATDCMCTSSDGISSSNSCSSSLTSANLYMHFNNMNNIALKYCNKNYAKGGICTSITTYDNENNPVDKDNATIWSMDANDFKKITGSDLSSDSCYGSNVSNRFACGYTNDLIDNGGYYWFTTPVSASSFNTFSWNPYHRNVSGNNSFNLIGVRPVLALESSIRVMGGKGTYKDPYVISTVVN